MKRVAGAGQGFTLIELMVVVAILGIIAVIGYPSYLQYTERARRTDATTTLLTAAQRLERCYTKTMAYDHADCNGVVNAASAEGYYSVSVTSTAATFVVEATPTGVQANDATCSELSINHLGQQQSIDSDGADSSDSCW
ncbi:MAG: type IV pilin protein [Aquisalimonadaceae bacterium]